MPFLSDFTIASHNIMDGIHLHRMLPTYGELQRAVGFGVLCLQENRDDGVRSHAALVQKELGKRFAFCCRGATAGLAIIYDARHVELVEDFVLPLPVLSKLPPFARFYITDGKPEQKYAQVAMFKPRRGEPFAVMNLHLDAAGDNAHRHNQVRAMVGELERRGLTRRLVACGDTNIFTIRKWRHRQAFEHVLSPLAAHGAVDPETTPTHFFARAREPKWGQRIAVALGRFRLDLPRRYDVMCTNLPVSARGQVHTPDSDHDLVWARVQVAARAAAATLRKRAAER